MPSIERLVNDSKKWVEFLESITDEEEFSSIAQSPRLLKFMRDAYPDEYIDSVTVMKESGKSFIIDKAEFSSLTPEQRQTISDLAEHEDLESPIVISVESDGGLIVD